MPAELSTLTRFLYGLQYPGIQVQGLKDGKDSWDHTEGAKILSCSVDGFADVGGTVYEAMLATGDYHVECRQW